jgi:hypothetical protein
MALAPPTDLQFNGIVPFGSLLELALPNPDDLYDILMMPIEKELTSAELPLLAERYKSEKPEQTRVRAERYDKAFAAYEKSFKTYMAALQTKLHEHQRAAMHAAESSDRSTDNDALTSLESRISGLSA